MCEFILYFIFITFFYCLQQSFDFFICFAENTERNFIRFADNTEIYFIRFAKSQIYILFVLHRDIFCFADIFLSQSKQPLHLIDMVISYSVVREITHSGCHVLKVTCLLQLFFPICFKRSKQYLKLFFRAVILIFGTKQILSISMSKLCRL